MQFISDNIIKLDRELSELDKFTLDSTKMGSNPAALQRAIFESKNSTLINNFKKAPQLCCDWDFYFIRILRKYTKYVIISGYVSILLGRSRSSEDVDIIIPQMENFVFQQLINEIRQNGFYCLNTDEEIFEYIKDNLAVRFAKVDTVVPNIELKFAKNRIDETALARTINVKLDSDELIISHLELQIAFKEIVLCSPKDIEDARHLRNIAAGHLDIELIDRYKVILRDF